MRSLGMTLTILTLTGALMALDLSGANRAGTSSFATMEQHAMKPSTVAQQLIDVEPTVSNTDKPAEEAEPELFNAFHVTAVPTVRVAAKPVVALRYD